MAIQHRRGVFERFDPARLVPGEWAIVLSGDDSAVDGRAVYVCFAAGVVKRVATYEDMVANIANADAEVVQQLTDGVRLVEQSIGEAEAVRAAAESERVSAESSRAEAEQGRVSAESSRVEAESGRAVAEAARVAEFAEIRQRSRGWLYYYCVDGEYDPETRRPTVGEPDAGTLYLVPADDPDDDNRWVEWLWDAPRGRWELQGPTHLDVSATPLPTGDIRGLLDGDPPQGSEVLTGAGLSYLWALLGTATVGQVLGGDQP